MPADREDSQDRTDLGPGCGPALGPDPEATEGTLIRQEGPGLFDGLSSPASAPERASAGGAPLKEAATGVTEKPWPVVGHGGAIEMLRHSLERGRLSHAYLFEGPAQVGKTNLARVFAQALNCTVSPGSPCGQCRPCRLIGRGVHPDLRIIEMLSPEAEEEEARAAEEEGVYRQQRTRIRIEEIRDLIRDASLLPYEARYKVYIIAGAENLSGEADDALLKTLEEPPAHVVLVLTATDPRLLPETVLSRCQPVWLGPVPAEEIEEALVAGGVDREEAHLLARISGGRAGWAIEAGQRPESLEERRQALSWMGALPAASRAQRFAWAEELANDFRKSRGRVTAVLQYWASWWRDVMLLNLGCDDLVTNIDFEAEMREQAAGLSWGVARRNLRVVEETAAQLRANVNARLALEAMMLSMGRPS